MGAGFALYLWTIHGPLLLLLFASDRPLAFFATVAAAVALNTVLLRGLKGWRRPLLWTASTYLLVLAQWFTLTAVWNL